MANYDDVNTPLVALIGFLGSIIVFAITVLLTVLYNLSLEHEEYVKDTSQPYTERETLQAAQRIKLVEYRWVDQPKQVTAIPIDRAMQLVVDQYRQRGTTVPERGEP